MLYTFCHLSIVRDTYSNAQVGVAGCVHTSNKAVCLLFHRLGNGVAQRVI